MYTCNIEIWVSAIPNSATFSVRPSVFVCDLVCGGLSSWLSLSISTINALGNVKIEHPNTAINYRPTMCESLGCVFLQCFQFRRRRVRTHAYMHSDTCKYACVYIHHIIYRWSAMGRVFLDINNDNANRLLSFGSFLNPLSRNLRTVFYISSTTTVRKCFCG